MFYQIKDKSTANNFKNAMTDGNMIVLYYADWCGYCQQFKPVWEDLKKKMVSSSKPMCHIGEVESANMHHLPDVEVRSYPTILFYKQRRDTPSQQKKKKTYLDVKKENTKLTKSINSFQELIQNMMGNPVSTKDETTKKHVIPFEEERSIANLLKFIRKNADSKTLKMGKKVVKRPTTPKKSAMGNLTQKLAGTRKTKKRRAISKTQTKGKKMKQSKGKKGQDAKSLKKYKNAKKEDKKTEKEIMNSFKNEL